MSRGTQPQSNSQVALMPEQFLRRTKAKSVRITTGEQYKENSTSKFPMPQAGLGSELWVIIAGTITVAGTVTSGTFKSYPNPAPYGIVRRIKFGSNNAFNIRDMSGWSWYKWVRMRYGFDPVTFASGSKYSAAAGPAVGNNVGTSINNGSNVSATTYNVCIAMPMPLAYNQAAENGLIVLQTNNTIFSLDIDWGTITSGIGPTGGSNDIFNALVGTGLTVTADLKVTIGLDWYEAIPGYDNLVKLFMSVNDNVQTGLNAGENIFSPPLNDYYTAIQLEVVNAGAPVALSNLQGVQFTYAGNVRDLEDEATIKALRDYYKHLCPPQDGCITYDFGIRKGQLSRRDTLDAFNNQNITDLKLKFTIPSSVTISGVNQISAVMESLRRVQQ